MGQAPSSKRWHAADFFAGAVLARSDRETIALGGHLSAAETRWLRDARGIAAAADGSTSDEQAFATRSRLVHEWRKFLFRDPGLPRTLLPED